MHCITSFKKNHIKLSCNCSLRMSSHTSIGTHPLKNTPIRQQVNIRQTDQHLRVRHSPTFRTGRRGVSLFGGNGGFRPCTKRSLLRVAAVNHDRSVLGFRIIHPPSPKVTLLWVWNCLDTELCDWEKDGRGFLRFARSCLSMMDALLLWICSLLFSFEMWTLFFVLKFIVLTIEFQSTCVLKIFF